MAILYWDEVMSPLKHRKQAKTPHFENERFAYAKRVTLGPPSKEVAETVDQDNDQIIGPPPDSDHKDTSLEWSEYSYIDRIKCWMRPELNSVHFGDQRPWFDDSNIYCMNCQEQTNLQDSKWPYCPTCHHRVSADLTVGKNCTTPNFKVTQGISLEATDEPYWQRAPDTRTPYRLIKGAGATLSTEIPPLHEDLDEETTTCVSGVVMIRSIQGSDQNNGVIQTNRQVPITASDIRWMSGKLYHSGKADDLAAIFRDDSMSSMTREAGMWSTFFPLSERGQGQQRHEADHKIIHVFHPSVIDYNREKGGSSTISMKGTVSLSDDVPFAQFCEQIIGLIGNGTGTETTKMTRTPNGE